MGSPCLIIEKSQAERKWDQCPQAMVCAQTWDGEDDPQTAHDLAFWHCQTLRKGEHWVTEKPHRLQPKAAFGEMRRPGSMSPVGSCSCCMTSGTRKSPMENHRLELLPRHPLARVPRGCCCHCVCLQNCGLRLSSLPLSAQTTPPAQTSRTGVQEGACSRRVYGIFWLVL